MKVNFIVNNAKTNSEEMGIVVPKSYSSIFENHNFKDMHELSMALMFASCADEAKENNKPWILKENENSLNNVIMGI